MTALNKVLRAAATRTLWPRRVSSSNYLSLPNARADKCNTQTRNLSSTVQALVAKPPLIALRYHFEYHTGELRISLTSGIYIAAAFRLKVGCLVLVASPARWASFQAP